jgi:hypothetical protein
MIDRRVSLAEVVETLRGERPMELRCRFCGGTEDRDTCPECDRGAWSCDLRMKPAMSWADYIAAKFGGERP